MQTYEIASSCTNPIISRTLTQKQHHHHHHRQLAVIVRRVYCFRFRGMVKLNKYVATNTNKQSLKPYLVDIGTVD